MAIIKDLFTDKEIENALLFLHQQILEEDKSGNATAVAACRTAIVTIAHTRHLLAGPTDPQDSDEVCERCGLLLDGEGDRQCYAGGSHSDELDLLYDPESLND